MIKKFLNNQVFKNSFLNINTKLISFSITLLFISYISRKLSKDDVGIYALLTIFEGIMIILSNLGMFTSIIRIIPELKVKNEFEKISDLIKISLFIATLFSLFISIILILNYKLLSQIFVKNYSFYIVWIIIICFFNSIFDRCLLIFQALQDFKKIFFSYVSVIFLQRLLAVIFLNKSYGLNGIFFGFLIGIIIGCFFVFLILKKYIFTKYYGYNIIEFLKFSFPYYLRGFTRYLFSQADQTLVAIIFKPEILAIYFIAKKILSFFTLVFESILDVIIPKLSEIKTLNLDIFKEKYMKVYNTFLPLVLISSFFIFINSKIFIFILGGKNYINMFFILNILTVAQYFYFVYSLENIKIYLLEKPSKFLLISLIVGVVNLISSLGLGIFFKLQGFALAQSIGFVTVVIFINLKNKEFIFFNKNLLLLFLFFIIGYYINIYMSLSFLKIILINFIFISLFIIWFFKKRVYLFE